MRKTTKPTAPAPPRGTTKTAPPRGGMKTVLLPLPTKEPADTPGPKRKLRRAT